MKELEQLEGFLAAAADDGRIATVHISLYLAIYQCWLRNDCENPIPVFRPKLMAAAKISGRTTYLKCLQELHAWGYLRYEPSFNPYLGSLVFLPGFPRVISTILMNEDEVFYGEG